MVVKLLWRNAAAAVTVAVVVLNGVSTLACPILWSTHHCACPLRPPPLLDSRRRAAGLRHYRRQPRAAVHAHGCGWLRGRRGGVPGGNADASGGVEVEGGAGRWVGGRK